MKHAICTVAAALLMLAAADQTFAGYCGGDGYNCCPSQACAAGGDYCAAKHCCKTCYKTVTETVWEKEEYTACKTVYDVVCEKVPCTTYQTVAE
ncbi:MAG: hypothetical protein KY476_26305, partial [Planctomycetes bacterium]|nr:hypothetical protein [Planctomycetota bacterium]